MEFTKNHTLTAKGLAVTCMLIHHLFGDEVGLCKKYHISTYPVEPEYLFRFGAACKVCVAVFVFLTAFGTARSFEQRNSADGSVQYSDEIAVCGKRFWKLMITFMGIYVLAAGTSFLRKDGFWGVYRVKGKWKGIMSAGIDAFGLSGLFGTPTLNETWWYMSFAFLLVFVLPVFIMLYQKHNLKMAVIMFVLIRIFCLCLPRIGIIRIIHNGIFYLDAYYFSVISGIWCAEKNIFERLYVIKKPNGEKISGKIKWLCSIFLISSLFLLRMYGADKTGYGWLESLIAITVCFISMLIMGTNNKSRILPLLGKHSMNIFLIHSFIYYYYFTDFIYGWKWWLLILFVLMCCSLMVSCMIELIKKCVWNYLQFLCVIFHEK